MASFREFLITADYALAIFFFARSFYLHRCNEDGKSTRALAWSALFLALTGAPA